MRDYSILHLKTYIQSKEQHFYCSSAFHGHSRVFNNKQCSYPKISAKRPCSWALLSPIPDKRYIWASVLIQWHTCVLG